MADSSPSGLFTFSQKADYWNELYECPGNLFEHLMIKRRDYAWQYVCSRFAAHAEVLDLGCGAGVLSEKLVRSGFRVTAADASPDMLELARTRLGNAPAGAYRTVHANCLDLPFPDGSFDVVVSLGMFGYFDEVSQALREIRRVLRPGGTLFISVRNAHTRCVFDLLQFAALPLRAARAVVRRLRQAPLPARKPGDDGFRIRIHQHPRRMIAGVLERGYALDDFDGLGYGPLTFAERRLLSAENSIRLSDFLERAFRASGLNRFSRWIADVSFYVFRRLD